MNKIEWSESKQAMRGHKSHVLFKEMYFSLDDSCSVVTLML